MSVITEDELFNEVKNFIESRQGQLLTKSHSMDEEGTWVAHTADDGMSPGKQIRSLGFFTGKLANVLEYLIATKKDFRGAYNSWGLIEKINAKVITPETTQETLALKQRAEELEAELTNIKVQLGI